MASIRIENVPEELHRCLRRVARKRRATLREVVLGAIERQLSHEEFIARLRSRSPVDVGRPAAKFLRAARTERK